MSVTLDIHMSTMRAVVDFFVQQAAQKLIVLKSGKQGFVSYVF